MKNGLMIAIWMGFLLWHCESFTSADFLVQVDTDRASASVPMGNVILREGTVIRFNSFGAIGSTNVSVGNNSSINIEVQPRFIFLTVTKGSTQQGSDLVVNSTFSPQTQVDAYSRKTALGGVVSTSANESFTADQNFEVDVSFNLAANSSAKQYQYYFKTAPATPLGGLADLDKGEFYTDSPTTPIPWSVISHLSAGNNLYGTIRVVDFALRSYDVGFEFDITPMGGGAAVPEPSTWWAIAIIASGYAGRTGWKRWRQKRSQRDGEIEGAAR